MKWDNEFYGHRAVLGQYAGYTGEAPPIWGYLQHGWHWGTGFPARYRFYRGFSLFVWTQENAAHAAAIGRRIVAIGAPFLYLRSLAERQSPTPPPSRGTIYYPFHTAPGQPVYWSHQDLIRAVRERETGDVTMCLYALDFDNDPIRRAYEEAGFRVVTHGPRSDPEFLWRQYRELTAHRRAATNRVATAIWYGAATGCEVEVYGPNPGQTPTDDGSDFDRFQRSHWPQLFDAPLDGRSARDLAGVELGEANLLSPQSLEKALGWTGWRRVLGPPILTALRTRRRVIARIRPPADVALPPDRPPAP